MLGLALGLLIYFWILGNAHPVKQIRYEKDMHLAEIRMETCRKEGQVLEKIRNEKTAADRSALWLQLALLRYEMMDTEGAIAILGRALTDDSSNTQLKETLKLMQEKPTNMQFDDTEI